MKQRLNALHAAVAVARLRGFKAAAEELNISPSALSHAVADLEANLGVRLFNRTTRSVSPTIVGAQFLARVEPALRDIDSAVEAINDHRDTPAGTLRINASVGAARMILAPIILQFLDLYPQMNVVLATDNRIVDIVGEGYDAGVRLTDAVPQDMIAVAIGGPVRMLVVGAPAYFASHPAPLTPQDLVQHRCIRARMTTGRIWRWEFEKHGEAVQVDVPGVLTLDDSSLMMDAALAGAGLAYLSEWSVRDHLAKGSLSAVLKDWTPAYDGLSLYYPRSRNQPAGLRAFIQLIREQNRRAPSL